MTKKRFQDLEGKPFLTTFSKEDNAVLLDVRTPREFDTLHLEGAINIDIKNRDFIDEINELDKSKAYFVYCRVGVRSANACNYMAILGFPKLYNLKGGLVALQKQDDE